MQISPLFFLRSPFALLQAEPIRSREVWSQGISFTEGSVLVAWGRQKNRSGPVFKTQGNKSKILVKPQRETKRFEQGHPYPAANRPVRNALVS